MRACFLVAALCVKRAREESTAWPTACTAGQDRQGPRVGGLHPDVQARQTQLLPLVLVRHPDRGARAMLPLNDDAAPFNGNARQPGMCVLLWTAGGHSGDAPAQDRAGGRPGARRGRPPGLLGRPGAAALLPHLLRCVSVRSLAQDGLLWRQVQLHGGDGDCRLHMFCHRRSCQEPRAHTCCGTSLHHINCQQGKAHRAPPRNRSCVTSRKCWRLPDGVLCPVQTPTSWTSRATAYQSGEICAALTHGSCRGQYWFTHEVCTKLPSLDTNEGAHCCAGRGSRTSPRGLTAKALPWRSIPACDDVRVWSRVGAAGPTKKTLHVQAHYS